MKRIGFVSTRIAGTDGVSLETFKWYQVLQKKGFECFFFAGELDTDPSHSLLEPKAHFEDPEILELHQALFGISKRSRALSHRIHELAMHLKERLYEFCNEFSIELLIPENALAIPMNIPLGIAITQLIAETSIPTIAHHHDFSWERKRFLINAVHDYLCYAFPPNLPSIRHVVINSAASRQLSYRRGLTNTVIPNVFDFENPPPPENPKSKLLRQELGFNQDELFVLQPTRVVPRKWIERAVELVNLLAMKRPRLVVSHEAGDEGDLYAHRILEYAERLGVEVLYIGHMIGPCRCFTTNTDRPFTMDDVYQAADLVTYPSGYEGFGNAFLEAVYFKRPLVVNRYSIFVEDIEPYGFDVVAFESFITREVVAKLKRDLEPERLRPAVEKNYRLGTKYFSYNVLEQRLMHLIGSFME